MTRNFNEEINKITDYMKQLEYAGLGCGELYMELYDHRKKLIAKDKVMDSLDAINIDQDAKAFFKEVIKGL